MLPPRFHTEFCSFPVDLFLENPFLYTIIILFNRTCEKKKPEEGKYFRFFDDDLKIPAVIALVWQ